MIETLKEVREALETGLYASREVAANVHVSLAGYKPEKHKAVDADVTHIESALTKLDALIAEQEKAEPVPPFGSKRKAAMAVYTPPFKYLHGYIYDSQNLMVADDDKVDGAVASRVRGWGRLSYMPDGAELQDEIGQMMADALNALYTAPSTSTAEPQYFSIERVEGFPEKLEQGPQPLLYSDGINGCMVRRDDVWLALTSQLAIPHSAPSTSPMTDIDIAAAIEVADAKWADADVPLGWAKHFARALEAKIGAKP